jgi:hypothetical protein
MSAEELILAPLSATSEETWAAFDYISRTMINTNLRHSLNIIKHNGFHTKSIIRSIKIKEHCLIQASTPYSIVPEILLRGKWLQKAGYHPDNSVWVLPFRESLIVIPQEVKSK